MSSIQSSFSRKMTITAAAAVAGALGLGAVPGTSRSRWPRSRRTRRHGRRWRWPSIRRAAVTPSTGARVTRCTCGPCAMAPGPRRPASAARSSALPRPATVAGSSTVVVGARGTDNALWVRTLSNGTWGPWRSWGGSMSSSPALAGASDGSIYAVIRGADGSVLAAVMAPGGAMSGWTRLAARSSPRPPRSARRRAAPRCTPLARTTPCGAMRCLAASGPGGSGSAVRPTARSRPRGCQAVAACRCYCEAQTTPCGPTRAPRARSAAGARWAAC